MIVSNEKCYICGITSNFEIYNEAKLLREARCNNCNANIRNSDIARIIMKTMIHRNLNLANNINRLKDFYILNTCSSGYIHDALKSLPHYYTGEYFDNMKSGDYNDGVLCMDLCNIPFYDHFFDLIITEDVLEHIVNYEKAISEIHRVLKHKGSHIFTIPLHEGAVTTSRINNLKKVYHGDPIRESGAFVATDFGDDIGGIIDRYGFKTRKIMMHKFYSANETTDLDDSYEEYLKNTMSLLSYFRYNSVVFVSKKVM